MGFPTEPEVCGGNTVWSLSTGLGRRPSSGSLTRQLCLHRACEAEFLLTCSLGDKLIIWQLMPRVGVPQRRYFFDEFKAPHSSVLSPNLKLLQPGQIYSCLWFPFSVKESLLNHLFTPDRALVFPCKAEIREIGLRLKKVDMVSLAGCVWKSPIGHFHPASKVSTRACLRSILTTQEGRRSYSARGNAAHHPQRQLAAARDKERSCCSSRGWEAKAWGLEELFSREQEGKNSRREAAQNLDQVLWLLRGNHPELQGADHFGALWAKGRGYLNAGWHSVLEILLPLLLSAGFCTGCSFAQACTNGLDYSYSGKKSV